MLRSSALAFVAAVALAGCSSSASDPATSTQPMSTAAPSSGAATSAVPAGLPTPKTVTVRNIDSTSDQGWSATNQIISGPKGTLLVDPGKYDAEVADYVKSLGGVDAILLTHGHWDKLRGLDAAVKANPGVKVYIHRLDQPYLTDPVRNCSIEDGFEGRTQTPTIALEEGTQTIGGYTVRTIHLPGHTEGSSVFVLPDENVFIGGDTIMADLVGSARHPGGDAASRTASIAKFKKLTFPADMVMYQGHGEQTTYAELMKSNRDLQ